MSNKQLKKLGTIFAGLPVAVSLIGLFWDQIPDKYKVFSYHQSGGVTAGVVNIYETATSTPVVFENGTLPMPLFSLGRDMDESKFTSADKEVLFKKYIGLTTRAEGYVYDVSLSGNDTVRVSLIERADGPGYEAIDCYFKEGTSTALGLKKGSKIRFWGIIDEYSSYTVI